MIASHYAEPIERSVVVKTTLRTTPDDNGETIRELQVGEPFALLDDSLGWAWGYAANDHRVGYLRTDALAAH